MEVQILQLVLDELLMELTYDHLASHDFAKYYDIALSIAECLPELPAHSQLWFRDLLDKRMTTE